MPRMYSEQKVKLLLKRESEVWIYSYADLITNLLAFFVLILTVKMADQSTVARIKYSLANVTGNAPVPGTIAESDFANVVTEMIAGLPQHYQVAVTRDTEGISMTFMGGLFFDTLSTDLSEEAKNILRTLASLIKKMPKAFRVDVSGHSDSRPVVDDSIYPSNWELSAARAASVVRFLVEQGVPSKRMRAIGYADTVPTSNNLDQNRRVVIRIGRGLAE